MLTGKTKIDFEKWYYTNYHRSVNYGVIKEDEVWMFFNTLHKTFKNALLVDFFDTVDIYIIINFIAGDFDYEIKDYFSVKDECKRHYSTEYETRSGALKQALIHANKIYNEKMS